MNDLDPYGQMSSLADLVRRRASFCSEEGKDRASRELRRIASEIDERFGAGDPLPVQPTMQVVPLQDSLQKWVNGWLLRGATSFALEQVLGAVLQAMATQRHNRRGS